MLPDWLLRRYVSWKNTRKWTGKEAKEVFTTIYQSNGWRGENSVSGRGSDLDQTIVIREQLPNILKHYNIRTILDIPCGDLHWISTVNLGNTKYIGGDIVDSLIELNRKKFPKENFSFEVINLITDKLPQADAILCRDCLVHFSYDNIFGVIRNLKTSSIKYLITTTFTNRNVNEDIVTGNWRPLNLQAAPFNFPDPLLIINEQNTAGNGDFSDKSLAVWEINALPTV